MEFYKEYLDLVLVPGGFLLMFGYHLYLLQRFYTCPEATIIGLENKDKKDWVQSIVEGNRDKDLDRAVNVISSNTTTTAYLATISLTLCSLIGTWLGSSSSSGNNSLLQSKRIYGDTRPYTIFIKDLCLLSCLLLAFSGFVNAARHLVHGNYLLSSPDNKNLVEKIEFQVIKGGEFWTFGLRALYFALDVLLWFFGPIPMFVASIAMVMILYYHDIYTVKMHDIYCLRPGEIKGKPGTSRARFSY